MQLTKIFSVKMNLRYHCPMQRPMSCFGRNGRGSDDCLGNREEPFGRQDKPGCIT
jgi:hypothetical protein